MEYPVQTKMPVSTLTFRDPFIVGCVYEILTLSTEVQHKVPASLILDLSLFNGTKILWELGPAAPTLLKTKVKAY